VTFAGSPLAARPVGALAEGSFALVLFAFMVLLSPTGRLPARRWRAVAAAGVVVGAWRWPG
jgi:hypothetical protein